MLIPSYPVTNAFPPPADLLVTKTRAPVVHSKIVQRKRLIERLRHGMNCKLTLVVAPAGFGKSTLIREWLSTIESLDWPVGWLTLDKDDNRPSQFWTYVVGALRSVDLDIQRDLFVDIEQPCDDMECNQLNPLINRLAAIPKQISLVLDDYQEIDDPGIHQSLSYFIEYLPENVHLVISSRKIPPLTLARLRILRQLVEIQSSDLSFNANETGIFLRNIMDLQVDTEDITTLVNLTEGWIAGLQLAALSLQDGKDPKLFLDDFAGNHRNIIDYLSEEVLSRQDAGIKEFLIKTSVLSKLTAPLCNALLGIEDSDKILRYIENLNLFIIPLDEQSRWYRYHALFNDALKAYLQRDYPEQVVELHRKACDWLIDNHYPEQAIPHALVSGAHELAADIVESCAFEAIVRFDMMMVIRWIDRLPIEIIRKRPQLGVYNAMANVHLGRIQVVENQLAELKAILDETADTDDRSEERTRLHRKMLAIRVAQACIRGEYDRGIEISKKAIARMNSEDYFLTGMIEHHVSYAYLATGKLSETISVLQNAIHIAQHNQFNREYVCSSLALARVYEYKGLLKDAAEVYRVAQGYAAKMGLEAELVSFLKAGLGDILREWNQIEEADRLLKESQDYFSNFGTGYLAFHFSPDLYLLFARNRYLRKDYTGSMQALFKMQDNLQRYHEIPFLADSAAALQVKIWLLQADRQQIKKWSEDTLACLESDPASVSLILRTALARVLISRGDFAGVPAILKDGNEDAQSLAPLRYRIEADCLLAISLDRQGKTSEAFDAVLAALKNGETGEYIRIFIDEGFSLKMLLSETHRRSVRQDNPQDSRIPSLDYLEKLVSCYDTPKLKFSDSRPKSVILDPLVESLSDRELQVLQLLADGYSSKQVAGNLVISVNTARSHIKNIYQKLDVHSKEDAVRQAIGLGLL